MKEIAVIYFSVAMRACQERLRKYATKAMKQYFQQNIRTVIVLAREGVGNFKSKWTYTLTSLAREFDSGRVPMNQTRPCVGRHEPGGPSPAGLARAFDGTRLGDGSLLVGTCVGGPEPDSRIYTPHEQTV